MQFFFPLGYDNLLVVNSRHLEQKLPIFNRGLSQVDILKSHPRAPEKLNSRTSCSNSCAISIRN